MNIYMLRADVRHYEDMLLINEKDWEVLLEFDGTSRIESWRPIEVRIPHDDLNKDAFPGDFPGLSPDIPVFSERAVHALRDLLEGHGEILPLLCEEGHYFAYNVTEFSHALDEEKSQFKYFDDGSVMDIIHYAFHTQQVRESVIFKLPQFYRSCAYVTDTFVQRAQTAGLVGFDFRLVWSSESK